MMYLSWRPCDLLVNNARVHLYFRGTVSILWHSSIQAFLESFWALYDKKKGKHWRSWLTAEGRCKCPHHRTERRGLEEPHDQLDLQKNGKIILPSGPFCLSIWSHLKLSVFCLFPVPAHQSQLSGCVDIATKLSTTTANHCPEHSLERVDQKLASLVKCSCTQIMRRECVSLKRSISWACKPTSRCDHFPSAAFQTGAWNLHWSLAQLQQSFVSLVNVCIAWQDTPVDRNIFLVIGQNKVISGLDRKKFSCYSRQICDAW